jgi:hypothetical protein
MFRWLRGENASLRSEPINHPVLGTLRFDPEVEGWRTVVATPAGSIGFLVAGRGAPDAVLLVHASDIAMNPAPFLDHVRSFLLAGAAEQPRWADEIKTLTLGEVCLFWPKRPNDGMLYFNGPDEHRVWRSDYRNRQAVGLGFDS